MSACFLCPEFRTIMKLRTKVLEQFSALWAFSHRKITFVYFEQVITKVNIYFMYKSSIIKAAKIDIFYLSKLPTVPGQAHLNRSEEYH